MRDRLSEQRAEHSRGASGVTLLVGGDEPPHLTLVHPCGARTREAVWQAVDLERPGPAQLFTAVGTDPPPGHRASGAGRPEQKVCSGVQPTRHTRTMCARSDWASDFLAGVDNQRAVDPPG